MYLVVRCEELGDQYECDANRVPICLTEDYDKYNKQGYEIYKVLADNTFERIREYDEITKEDMVVAIWSSADAYNDEPTELIHICDGDRNAVTTDMIKTIKRKYHFKESIKDIKLDISSYGTHTEETEDNGIIVFAERFDGVIQTDW